MLAKRNARSVPTLISGLFIGASLLLAAPRAWAEASPSRAECLNSHAQAQESRLEGELLEAREQLRVCANPACPNVVRTECAAWLVSVQQAIPSVVFLAENESGDVFDVKVVVDGKVLAEKLDGKAFELDPGAHRFEFELEGYPKQEQTIVIRQDEKRRAIRVVFSREVQKPEPAETVGALPAPSEPQKPVERGPASRPVPASTWVFGGIALGSGVAATVLGVTGLSDYGDKKDQCAPLCSKSDVKGVKTKLLLADVAGGVALVSAGLATYFYLTRPEVYEAAPEQGSMSPVSVAVGTSGVSVELSGSF